MLRSRDTRLTFQLDLSAGLRDNLVRQNANEQSPHVGEVFFRILDCDPSDGRALGFWWSQIRSANGIGELRRLIRRPSLSQAFRAVARFPAFGRQMLPGNIGDMLRLRCDEEVIHGLCHIALTWSEIFHDVSAAEHRLDPRTVEVVQRHSVKHCRADRELLEPLVRRGTVFGHFSCDERQIIWRNLLTLSGRIPSLAMFFEDFKHLEDVGKCVRSLFHLPRGRTLSQTLEQSFVSPHDPASSRERQYDLARRRLFLFATRHLPRLRPLSILLGDDKERTVTEATAWAWHGLAKEAHRLGFRSAKIDTKLAEDPDRIEAHRSLLRARDPGEFVYDADLLASLLDRVVAIYAQARRVVSDPGPALYVVDDNREEGEGQEAQCREGRPVQRDFEASAAFLTLENMHPTGTWDVGRLTPLFIRRDVYLSFWGDLKRPLDESSAASVSASSNESGVISQQAWDQEPSDFDGEMRDLDGTDEIADNAMVLVRPRLYASDSASHYSQSLDDDVVTNATNRVVGAGALQSPSGADFDTASVSTDRLHSPEVPTGEMTGVSQPAPSDQAITLVIHQGTDIHTSNSIHVDGHTSSAVEDVIAEHINRGIYPFDTALRALALEQCFDAAVADPDRTLLLMPRRNVTLSTAQMLEQGFRKRPASQEIHARPRKRALVRSLST